MSSQGPAVTGLVGRRPGAVRALKITGLLSFVLLWQVVGSASPEFYSTPSRVVVELWQLLSEGRLVQLTAATCVTMLLGLLLSIAIGITIGLALGLLRPFSVAFEPVLAAFYTIPSAPWVPLMVVWFGINRSFAIAVVVIATTVQVAFSTAAGVRETQRQFSNVARAYRIGGWTLFAKVLLPGSIPFIGAGIRLAIKHAFTAALIAEYLVGISGLGLLIRGARESLATDRVFATAIAALIVGLVLIGISVAIERRLQRWRPVGVGS